jgi:hypothetical protein
MSRNIITRDELLLTHFRGQQITCKSLAEAATLRSAEKFLAGGDSRDPRQATALAAALQKLGQHDAALAMRELAAQLRSSASKRIRKSE